jgi:regulator of protease activity HflC (stomatin/prohibitin superfamily)
MEDNKTSAMAKNAEAEILKTLEEAEQKLHRAIEESRKTANEEASKTFKELEQKVRQIIQEAVEIAEAVAAGIVAQAEDKAQQIIEEAKKKAEIIEKAAWETADEGGKPKAAHKRRVELVIIPPIDFVQLEKLRVSLQQLANVRILSMWGNSDGGASIFVLTERPVSLIPDLRKIDVVDEAIEINEVLLDCDLISKFVKNNLPLRPSKRDGEQRVLVLLKRTG